ncbi:STAS domain-containing protein [Metabacillus halosaccharovorans]|uniref:STAS domain-containing protein n=1 Tax=Metabacillus halosaccharovorans TaxID=930124 RepID=UPI0020413698|nr:STAS domain-containing protein [Metabacillus halosaccharovorans]MCM3443087.1 STAS domain-containing protein [Metabacillus halosaccharovorans]
MLSIYTVQKKKIVTVKLEGCLCDYLGREIDVISLSKNSKGILLDLSGVTYIDSTGLIDLINWAIESKNHHLPLFFKGISKQYLDRLHTLGLSDITSCPESTSMTVKVNHA